MQSKKKRIAIIGTNGIPARYGGFETLAENLVDNLRDKYSFTVYCSKIYKKNERLKEYNGAKLIYLPFSANGLQSIIFDSFCFFHAIFFSETILFLGPTSTGIITILNFFFRRKLIINHGGLNEWEREKYKSYEKKWAKVNHWCAAKNANINIADNTILQKSLKKSFNVDSIIIRYGGDSKQNLQENSNYFKKYSFANHKYFLCVARAQIDNNLHLLFNAFKEINTYPLVIVSNWETSEYGRNLKLSNDNSKNIICLDSIYRVDELNFLRSNCYLYIHSHSYCGTAPSLVEVMNLNVPIICFDVPTNRETTQNKTRYFSSEIELQECIETLEAKELSEIKSNLFLIAKSEFYWEKIAKEYALIF